MKVTAKEMATALLTRHEGRRKYVYTCPAGKLTIGVGRNLEDTGLRDTEIDFMLANDIDAAEMALQRLFGLHVVLFWTTHQQAALLDMYVQLGYYRFRSFKKMIAAISRGDWNLAAQEALDSKWARQDNPTRAAVIANMLKMTE